MNEEIVCEFSGWFRVDASKINFQYTGEDESVPGIISGSEYIKLSEEKKQYYTPENIWDGLRDSSDSELTDVQIIEEVDVVE